MKNWHSEIRKDSINEIAISKKTNTESKLNILFNLSRFVETARIFNVRKAIKYVKYIFQTKNMAWCPY